MSNKLNFLTSKQSLTVSTTLKHFFKKSQELQFSSNLLTNQAPTIVEVFNKDSVSLPLRQQHHRGVNKHNSPPPPFSRSPAPKKIHTKQRIPHAIHFPQEITGATKAIEGLAIFANTRSNHPRTTVVVHFEKWNFLFSIAHKGPRQTTSRTPNEESVTTGSLCVPPPPPTPSNRMNDVSPSVQPPPAVYISKGTGNNTWVQLVPPSYYTGKKEGGGGGIGRLRRGSGEFMAFTGSSLAIFVFIFSSGRVPTSATPFQVHKILAPISEVV